MAERILDAKQTLDHGCGQPVRTLGDSRDGERIERDGKGRCSLVRGNIPNESEAERLARGTSGDPPPPRKRPSSKP